MARTVFENECDRSVSSAIKPGGAGLLSSTGRSPWQVHLRARSQLSAEAQRASGWRRPRNSGPKVRIDGAMRQAGGLHHIAHAYVLKSALTERAGSLFHNPFMFGGGIPAVDKCRKLKQEGLRTVFRFRSRDLATDDRQLGVAVPSEPAATAATENEKRPLAEYHSRPQATG